MRNGLWTRRLSLTLILGAVGLAIGDPTALRAGDSPDAPALSDRAPLLNDDGVADLEKLSNAFARISDEVKPSVVHIKALSINKAMNRELRRMLGDENLPPTPTTGTGSGIIIDEDGHIVTNNHVVADAKKIYVTLADGRKFTGHVVGTDPKTDLAVIKINGDRLKPAKLGDSERLRPGQIVLAIGSPFRLGHSVSHGIISAMGRSEDSIDVDIAYKNWIQTDAPINPGNSGGPLINTRGEVIGINVAIATESGGHQGVGFAIPANTVARIASALKNGEKIVRGYLGVLIKPVDDRVAEAYGLDDVSGAFITGVVSEDSPAAKAGLQPEDIVLRVAGKSVRSQADLQELISTYKPGAEVDLDVWRKGVKSKVIVTVGLQPEGFSTRAPLNSSRIDPHLRKDDEAEDIDDDKSSNGRFGEFGFEAETLTPVLAKKYRLDSEADGVLITQVDMTSEAYECGLRARMVIVAANDKPIETVTELQEVLTKELLAKGVRLKYRVDSDYDFLVLRVR
ncbi:MAG: Do family serine endopeptidase [Planctomycetes bacterium]|nr:Do family serine endopeptidase [Planctomycetota bacterium]